MLKKPNRLLREKDFEAVFESGNSFGQGSLFLKFKKNNTDETRFGLIVSKKFSKKATERNRVKRLLREAIKGKLAEIKKGLDLVIIVGPKLDQKTINHDLSNILKKARVYK